jgi:hypothetical protein
MASPPNEIPFFVIKAVNGRGQATKEKSHDEHSHPPSDLKDLPTTEL